MLKVNFIIRNNHLEMDKNYRLAHLIGPTLRHRRIELGISEGTILQKFRLKISVIEKSSDLQYNELVQLCKYYDWSLSQFFAEVDFLSRMQKMA